MDLTLLCCTIFSDYKKDMMAILSRPLEDDEMRTELEIEVLMKWVVYTYHLDPTGVQHTIYMCSSRKIVVNALQHCRIEQYFHPEYMVLQNQAAGPDEGLYTILNGRVDIIIFSPDSPNLVRLETAKKAKHDEEIFQILKFGTRVAQLNPNSGFGELSAIANVRRGASVCASKLKNDDPTDVLVVTKESLIDLLAQQHSKEQADGDESEAPPASAEVMDYLRQSGLAHKTAISDLLQAAACFKKVSCESGTLLYRKGDVVDKIFIVLGGEFLLDTGDYDESKNHTGLPFQSLEHSKCYILRRGSILGDEGMIGKKKVYQASALSLAEDNIIFEVSSFGLQFLSKRFGLEKYSALAMKEQSPSNNNLASVLKSEVMVHSAFTCLRKCIASQNPSRGFNHPIVDAMETDDQSLAGSTVFPPLPQSPMSKSSSVGSFSGSIKSKKSKAAACKAGKNTVKREMLKSTDLRKTQNSIACHDYPRLPPAAMHHAKMVVKQVQIRELSVIRNDSRRNVEAAAKELSQAKAGLKKVSTKAELKEKEILEEKYQRAVGIYKNHLNENLTLRVYGDSSVDENSDSESVIDSSTASPLKMHDITSVGFNSQISFVDMGDDDDAGMFSDDDDEYRSSAFDSDMTKVEQYLLFLSLKKKKESLKKVHGAHPTGYNRLGSALARSPSGGPSSPGVRQENRRVSAEMSGATNTFASPDSNVGTVTQHRRSKRSSVDSPAPVSGVDMREASATRLPNRLSSAGQVRKPNPSKRSSVDASIHQKVGATTNNGHAGSMKLTAKALKEHELKGDSIPGPPPIPMSTPENKNRKEPGFTRMTTVHTLGVETVLVTDKEGITRRIFAKNQAKPNFGNPVVGGSGGGAGIVDWAADSSIESDNTFRKNNPKLSNESPPVKSIEKIFGIATEKPSEELPPRKHVPEHLWITRYMKCSNRSAPDKNPLPLTGVSDDDFDSYKSDSSLSYSQSLIKRARQELAENLASATVDMTATEEEAAELLAAAKTEVKSPLPSKKKQFSQWQVIATDPTAAAKVVKDESKVDILQAFSNLMKEERQATSFIDGRRKNINQSEFRFNRDIDKLNTVDEISSLSQVNQSSKDLLLWKKFCSERVVSVNKGKELKQIPIRSKTGFHTIYWGKLMIDKSDGS